MISQAVEDFERIAWKPMDKSWSFSGNLSVFKPPPKMLAITKHEHIWVVWTPTQKNDVVMICGGLFEGWKTRWDIALYHGPEPGQGGPSNLSSSKQWSNEQQDMKVVTSISLGFLTLIWQDESRWAWAGKPETSSDIGPNTFTKMGKNIEMTRFIHHCIQHLLLIWDFHLRFRSIWFSLFSGCCEGCWGHDRYGNPVLPLLQWTGSFSFLRTRRTWITWTYLNRLYLNIFLFILFRSIDRW